MPRRSKHQVIQDRRWPDGALVPRPEKTDLETLREHYKAVNDLKACIRYDEYQDRCRWCLAVGREIPETSRPRGDGVFCSGECQAQWDIYQPAKVVTGKSAGRSEEEETRPRPNLGCPDHPNYGGKRRPRTGCEKCLTYFKEKHR